MKFKFGTESVEVFTISPRTTNPADYWANIEKVIGWSDQYNATGVLLFEGNDTLVQPWLASHAVMANTESLCPLVAVNPVYMHPFTAAKMVSSFAYLYGRRTFLNMITGTALSYLQALDDHFDKDQRYERLREYSELIRLLIASQGQPVTYDGAYYRTKNLKLEPPVPSELEPVFYIAGQSEGAVKTASAINAVRMQMLSSQFEKGLQPGVTGIHFGIVTREDEDAAWTTARELFSSDAMGRRMQAMSMNNTDSAWKQRMMMAAKMEGGGCDGFWLEPFRNFAADCPYVVGNHNSVSLLLASLVRNGIRHIIVDVPAHQQEFAEVDEAFRIAAELLAARTVAE